MFKKIVCLLLAAVLAAALCACATRGNENNNHIDDGLKPEAEATPKSEAAEATKAPVSDTTMPPVPDEEEGQYFVPTEVSETVFDDVDPDTVLLVFTGLKEVSITAEQLAEMDIYDYSESTSSDTPVYSGPLVKEVLQLAGVEGVSVISVVFGDSLSLDFLLTDIDLSSAIFAVAKNGKLIEEGSAFICTTNEGFNYVLDVSAPYILK